MTNSCPIYQEPLSKLNGVPYILDAYIKESLGVITALSGTPGAKHCDLSCGRTFDLYLRLCAEVKCNATWRMQYKLSLLVAMLCAVGCYAR